MPPLRRLKRRHLPYKTGSFSILLWCGLLFCGHLERWLRTGDGVTKLYHCCVFFGLHLKTGTALDQVCLPAWNFRPVPTPNLFLSSEPPFLHLSHWPTSRKTKDPEITYTLLSPHCTASYTRDSEHLRDVRVLAVQKLVIILRIH